MPEPSLRHCRILVAEDEFWLAEELCDELGNAGAVVVGPAATLKRLLELIDAEQPIDGAILDVNLQGQMAFPAADLLRERGVSFVFATGYDGSAFPSRFADVVRCNKPISIAKVARALGKEG